MVRSRQPTASNPWSPVRPSLGGSPPPRHSELNAAASARPDRCLPGPTPRPHGHNRRSSRLLRHPRPPESRRVARPFSVLDKHPNATRRVPGERGEAWSNRQRVRFGGWALSGNERTLGHAPPQAPARASAIRSVSLLPPSGDTRHRYNAHQTLPPPQGGQKPSAIGHAQGRSPGVQYFLSPTQNPRRQISHSWHTLPGPGPQYTAFNWSPPTLNSNAVTTNETARDIRVNRPRTRFLVMCLFFLVMSLSFLLTYEGSGY